MPRAVGGQRRPVASESRKTVVVALAANATIFVVKLAGALVSGSGALLAEAAHSLADTTNQAFLLISLRLGDRPPDEEHPFGHGQDRFLWAFMAAMFMFVGGAVFAVGYGINALIRGEGESGFLVAWVTLAIASTAEVISWVRAVRQTRAEARAMGLPYRRYLDESRDPTVKAVVFEDSAAVAGIALAAAGVGLHQLTGNAAWDALATILIGLLLMGTGIALGRDIRALLMGQSARPEERERIERILRSPDEVDDLVELLTMVLGPHRLLVCARLDLRDGLTTDEIEELSSRLADELHEAVPDVRQVFLDPTARGAVNDRQRRARESQGA